MIKRDGVEEEERYEESKSAWNKIVISVVISEFLSDEQVGWRREGKINRRMYKSMEELCLQRRPDRTSQ